VERVSSVQAPYKFVVYGQSGACASEGERERERVVCERA